MFKQMLKLISLMFLVACGNDDHPVVSFKPESLQIVKCKFESTFTGKVHSLTLEELEFFFEQAKMRDANCFKVRSIDLENPEEIVKKTNNQYSIGYCSVSGIRKIRFSNFYWENASPSIRRTLMLHEMGHCALGLSHAPEDSLNIMAPSILDEDIFEENLNLLIDKLFNLSLD